MLAGQEQCKPEAGGVENFAKCKDTIVGDGQLARPAGGCNV